MSPDIRMSKMLEKLTGKFTLAFYQGMGADKSFRDKVASRAISLWTRSKITHTELVFPDGCSYSSSAMDGGVRRKVIQYSHPERWVFVKLCHRIGNYEACYIQTCRESFDLILGADYDHKGIWLGEFLPFRMQDPNKWYCSEACKYALNWRKPHQVSPKELHAEAIRWVCEADRRDMKL